MKGEATMKKIVAALLAACLALSPGAGHMTPVYGAAGTSQTQQTQNGVLEIGVASFGMYPYEGSVTVGVSGPGGYSQQKELLFTQSASGQAEFDVPAGTYTVTVKAKKFADYVQTIEVKEGWTHRIHVSPVQTGTGTSAKTGWLRAGDIDGDGDIDKADQDALLEAIRSNRTDSVYDLNSDGKTDLADLDALVQSMDDAQESTIETVCYPAAMQSSDNLTTEGDTGKFLQGKGGIILKTKNGGPVSESNPVEFTLTMPGGSEGALLGGFVLHAPADVDENGSVTSQITGGSISIVSLDANGQESVQTVPFGNGQRALASMRAAGAKVETGSDGSIIVDFGGQIAVKRVVIRITGTKKNQPLVEIAKVEFVNDMENRIPEPQLDIPVITSVKPGSKKLTVAWKPQANVTGYELQITGPVSEQNATDSQIISSVLPQCDVSSINNKSLINYKTYTVKVRSVNGTWRSPWSEEQTGMPVPQGMPDPPDNVKAEGGYRSVTVSWKKMDDSDGYMVYYKETDAGTFQPVISSFQQQPSGAGRLTSNSFTISGLKDHVSYSVYVISWNEAGWSSPSLTASAITKSDALPQLPKYKLLNTSNGTGKLTAHIKSAVYGGSGGAGMKGSPLDSGKTALGLVDDDYGSYWSKEDWDDGVSYPGPDKGMEITLDGDYKMNYLTFAATDLKSGYDMARIQYWDSKDPDTAKTIGARVLGKTDDNDNTYFIVKFDGTVTLNRLRLFLGRSWGNRSEMKVAEIHFHQYDSLEDDIMALYTDEMHTTLRSDVTEAVIKALESRLETKDSYSGEKHPLYKELAIELQTARDILNSNLDPAYEVHNEITSQKDKHLGFTGLNAWQPLGKTAYAGEALLVFVGHNTKRTGDAANLQLVYTQHHAEAANVSRAVNLKVGKNMITVPQLASLEFERGGQLYIAYTGNNAADKYAVRIGGGSSIPALDVYQKTGEARTRAIRAYIEKLESHVPAIQASHDKVHKGNKNVDYDYDAKNCVLNSTDILMDQMLYSMPASQVLASLGSGGLDAKVTRLDNAIKAMDQLMTLFYQHKGLNAGAGTSRGNNAPPSGHLNIRYMRMFAGAFMYASGNHIGIEWGSCTLAGATGINSFGWGIAHEIGHDINQGAYAVAEITNNYFAQLLRKIENGTTRFKYDDVFKKVTSNTKGKASNVFVQLAMYWQLHLAYDNNKNDGQIYDKYEDQFNNLFFARVDTYARNPDKAPQAGLKLDGGADQNLMRLACAAANANILPFFERWGMEPDEATRTYADKYGTAEAKALYYTDDAARDYRVDHASEEAAAGIAGKDVTGTPSCASVPKNSGQKSSNSNMVAVTIPLAAGTDRNVIQGFEITRTMYSDGKAVSQVVGFQRISESGDTVFTDTVSTVNNRVMYYTVRAVDKFMNYSLPKEAGSIKIQTEGELDKSGWSISTSMTSGDDKPLGEDAEAPDSGYDTDNAVQAIESSITRIIDNDWTTDTGTYKESAKDAAATATITIDMCKEEAVTCLKYMGSPLATLTVEVSADGQNWTKVRGDYTGLANLADNTEATIWFNAVKAEASDKWIGTYDARYVKLTIGKSGAASIREIELCGPRGDNVEFYTSSDSTPAVGLLKNDWVYGSGAKDKISQGSLIFTGKYKGNPAYNVIILYDEKGNVAGSLNGEVKAGHIILAPDPENGNLGETEEGTWVYYVEPGDFNADSIKAMGRVRAELYRVDDAKTLEGERIVSDSAWISVPEMGNLPEITLQGNTVPGN